MAGHSKFKNIMHRKGAQDAKRSKMFAKLSKEISVAAKLGAPEPDMNPRLRLAIQAAKAQSMPKDNIERAIKKSLSNDMENFEEIRYEGYAPGGVAIIVEAMTDNRNRTASEVRSTFSKRGGSMGETGAVSFMFDRVGQIEYPSSIGDEDAVMDAAIDAGASDVETTDEGHLIFTEPSDLHEVAKALEAQFGDAQGAGLIWKPQNTNQTDDETGEKIFNMIDALEDIDDVQTVYSNFEPTESLMEKLGA